MGDSSPEDESFIGKWAAPIGVAVLLFIGGLAIGLIFSPWLRPFGFDMVTPKSGGVAGKQQWVPLDKSQAKVETPSVVSPLPSVDAPGGGGASDVRVVAPSSKQEGGTTDLPEFPPSEPVLSDSHKWPPKAVVDDIPAFAPASNDEEAVAEKPSGVPPSVDGKPARSLRLEPGSVLDEFKLANVEATGKTGNLLERMPSAFGPGGGASTLKPAKRVLASEDKAGAAERELIRNGAAHLHKDAAGRTILYGDHLRDEDEPEKPLPGADTVTKISPPGKGGVRLAIVIDDLGFNGAVSTEMVRLPADVTLAVLPGGAFSRKVAKLAESLGKEVILHQPMEPDGYPKVNPGPSVILISMEEAGIQRILLDNLRLFPNAVGVNNHMGSKFTKDKKGLDVVMGVLKSKGLFFVDSRTAMNTLGISRALSSGVPTVRRDIFIDNRQDKKAILQQLHKLEVLGRAKGKAVGIGHGYAVTLAALKEWLPGLSQKGITLVRVSSLVASGTR